MDPATLAATLVGTYLVPLVSKQLTAATGKLTSAAADFAAGVAGKLWTKVQSTLSGEGEKHTVEDFQAHPVETQKLLELKLKEKFEQDASLFKDFEQLMSQVDAKGRTAAQIIENSGVMVNLQNANFQNAQHVEITGAKYGSAPPDPVPNRPGGDGSEKS